MAEYLAVAEQNVALNSPVLFTASIPCRRGNIYHEDETGVFILRGNTNSCFARYLVDFNGNAEIPEDGGVTPIALAITENGEPRQSSKSKSKTGSKGVSGEVFYEGESYYDYVE